MATREWNEDWEMRGRVERDDMKRRAGRFKEEVDVERIRLVFDARVRVLLVYMQLGLGLCQVCYRVVSVRNGVWRRAALGFKP